MLKDWLQNFSIRRPLKILWLLIIFYCLTIFSLLVWKYYSYGYNAMDLGIYNQVFFNSSQGHLFQFSIHPHSYLGDHFEIFILLLLPLYKIIPSALTLLFLQTAVIALSAWPLFLLARRKLNPTWSLFIPLVFLINPFVLNMAFFEFHLLPFAIFLLLFCLYYYLKNRFGLFLIFSCLALLVREDVSLVILMFGFLAWLDKKRIKWILAPLIMGGSWFIIAIQLTGYFNKSGAYKFISLYGWLGGSLREMVINFLTKPWLVAQHLTSFENLFFLIGLILPLAALPLLKPKYLLPGLLIFGQLMLGSGSATIILQTHYTALIIPFLFIASIYALSSWQEKIKNGLSKKTFMIRQKTAVYVVIFVAPIYSFFTFSPLLPALQGLLNNKKNAESVSLRKAAVKQVSENDAVLASFDFLPALSNREYLYSLRYAFLGQKQFSLQEYRLPDNTEKMIIDFNDFIILYLQYYNSPDLRNQYLTGAERLNQFIRKNNFGLKQITDDIGVYEKNVTTPITLVEYASPSSITKQERVELNNNLSFLGWEKNNSPTKSADQIIPLSLYWQAKQTIDDDYQFELILKNNKNETIFQKFYPLGYGLTPTRSWEPNRTIKTNYWFLLPKIYNLKEPQLFLQVVSIKGYMELDGVRSTEMVITKREKIGEAIPIDL